MVSGFRAYGFGVRGFGVRDGPQQHEKIGVDGSGGRVERESSAHRRIRSRLVASALERGGEGAALGRIGGVGAGELHAGGAERAGRGEGCVV